LGEAAGEQLVHPQGAADLRDAGGVVAPQGLLLALQPQHGVDLVLGDDLDAAYAAHLGHHRLVDGASLASAPAPGRIPIIASWSTLSWASAAGATLTPSNSVRDVTNRQDRWSRTCMGAK